MKGATDCIEHVRSLTREVMLFCSLGKDSIVVLDKIYGKFDRIVCVFMYFVPHLEHIDRWIGYVRARYPKVEFVQVPHWNLTYILRTGLYCVPHPDVRLMKLRDVVENMRISTGIDYVFLGMKKADSLNRRLMLDGYASGHYVNMGLCYPLAEWTQKEVLSYMRHHGLPEPVRYGRNASNGVGFNEDCFLWMRKNFPGDLEKIYEVFPQSERILFEYDAGKAREKDGEKIAVSK